MPTATDTASPTAYVSTIKSGLIDDRSCHHDKRLPTLLTATNSATRFPLPACELFSVQHIGIRQLGTTPASTQEYLSYIRVVRRRRSSAAHRGCQDLFLIGHVPLRIPAAHRLRTCWYSGNVSFVTGCPFILPGMTYIFVSGSQVYSAREMHPSPPQLSRREVMNNEGKFVWVPTFPVQLILVAFLMYRRTWSCKAVPAS